MDIHEMICVQTDILLDIEKIENKCFSDAWNYNSINDTMKYNYNHIFVVVIKEELVGYLICSIISDQSELLRIAVKEEFRGNQIARQLIETYHNYLSGNGIESDILEVRGSNMAAKSLYELCGYENINVRKGYYKNPTEDAYIYLKQLV